MTETGAGAVIIANHEPRPVGTACFGRATPATDLRVVDEAGQDVPDGTPGELLVRAAGPDPRAGFFREYLHDATATAEAWAGGWFHTGRRGVPPARRRPGVRGPPQERHPPQRREHRRRGGGKRPAPPPRRAGRRLRRHPRTPSAARKSWPASFPTQPVADHAATAAAIVQAALADLSYFKVPGYVAFVDALPLTATNKVQRGELKQRAATLPGTPACIDTRALKTRQPA